MNRYRRDPFLDECSSEDSAASASLRLAKADGYRVVEAERRASAARRRLDHYLLVAAELTEEERTYAVEQNMPATALVDARAKYSRGAYLDAIAAGKPLPSLAVKPSLVGKPRPSSHASRLPDVVCGVDVGLVTPLFAGR